MKYELFTVELPDGSIREHVVIYFDENNAETFPADENNPRYQRFLAELDTEPKV